MSQIVGITSTVPHEILCAAGCKVVDLNNLFIGAENCHGLLEAAENEGFPTSICSWIKGMYGVVKAQQIDTIVAVINGDCSNTEALAEVLVHRGVRVVPFIYPNQPDPQMVRASLNDFAERMGTGLAAAEKIRRSWIPLRRRLVDLDRLAWEEGKVSSSELHEWLVSASDFWGDPEFFDRRLQEFLTEAKQRKPRSFSIRLALLGVPPIYQDLCHALEERGAAIVFAEVPRQFAMPYECADLIEQFCRYTYPYDLSHRLSDLTVECRRREVRGAINYLQAFCHRQIEDIVLREKLPMPVLALEGDRPGDLSGQAITRLEAFLEMLR